MTYTVAPETFESLADSWDDLLAHCPTNTPFLSLPWQRLWWRYFADDYQPIVLGIAKAGQRAGIASLLFRKGQVTFLGNTDVCDYQDFILPAEHSYGGVAAVLDHLEPTEWSSLVLHSVPDGSPTIDSLQRITNERGLRITIEQEDTCPRAELPADWEAFLLSLSKKDRHELRRKQRRLEQAGRVTFYPSNGEHLEEDLQDFFRLHRMSREEKAEFMTEDMADFFRSVADEFVRPGIGRLFFLDIDGVRTASAMCFDYAGKRLLYNSGYDLSYGNLSVGLLLKAFMIRDALECGMSTFDFLRGNEPYKYDLGGVDHPIYTLTVER